MWGKGEPEPLTFGWEHLKDVVEEALPLIRRHFDGLGMKDVFNPDWQGMLFWASQGRFCVLTARNLSGKLVGYSTGMVAASLFAQDERCLMVNTLYIEPTYRGSIKNVRRMLDHMQELAIAKNCKRMEMSPQGVMRKGIGRLLKKSGWIDSEEPVYWKVF